MVAGKGGWCTKGKEGHSTHWGQKKSRNIELYIYKICKRHEYNVLRKMLRNGQNPPNRAASIPTGGQTDSGKVKLNSTGLHLGRELS
jgi:hypothetical protein